MSPLGPFQVAPEQVVRLGSSLFAEFVNRLLELEVRASDIPGRNLEITYNITTPDGGVDADLKSDVETDWVPSGHTVWQFKATNPGPKDCKKELKKASWAHEAIKAGANYLLTTSADLPPRLIATRREALLEQAVALGLLQPSDGHRILVYGAEQLARWASSFPSFTGSQLLGGPTVIADFDFWSRGEPHRLTWVSTPDRDAAITTIRAAVAAPGLVHLRVQGESGLGKTRLVMEAVREAVLSPFVAYVSDEDRFDTSTSGYLSSGLRQTILVVDECPPDRHIKVLEKIPSDANIKLITLGEVGSAGPEVRMIRLQGLTDSEIDDFLKTNYQAISAEARRFVTAYCYGNVRWAAVLADAIKRAGQVEAANIIARDDIERFVNTILPEGRDFLSSAVLALFETIGWDKDRTYQREVLAAFLHTTAEDLLAVGESLELAGLFARRGRYRQIAPLPLAAYLAARAWEQVGDRIVGELLPGLDDEMTLNLFKRAADLGRFSPLKNVLRRVLQRGGGFDSLQEIADNHRGRQLTQLAIVLPEEVVEHLGELFDHVDDAELRALTTIRRDLMWTLEKLVWHTGQFARAAELLLRLALNENESYGNNATGTWLGLFAVMLPATAAPPQARTAYLDGLTRAADPKVRGLVVSASQRGLNPHHETVMVSGEIQGGVLVEPRGQPATWQDVWNYQDAAADRLALLATDEDPEVRKMAVEALVKSIHSTLPDQRLLERLTAILLRFSPDELTAVRREVDHLQGLFSRVTIGEDDRRPAGLEWLVSQLPAAAPRDEVETLLGLNRWDFDDGELANRLAAAVTLLDDSPRLALLNRISQEDLPAAYEAGRALALAGVTLSAALEQMIPNIETAFSGLVGFLYGTEEQEAGAFDAFLNSEESHQLTAKVRLAVAVRAPVSETVRRVVFDCFRELSVVDGISASFGWSRNVDTATASQYLAEWIPRIATETDYQALVQWLSLWLPGSAETVTIPTEVADQVWDVVQLRGTYPEIRQESWDWCRVAKGFLTDHARELVHVLLHAVADGDLMIHESDYEAELIRAACRTNPTEIWDDLAEIIEQRNWRLEMEVRGWLLDNFPPEVIASWIGNSQDRARMIASLATASVREEGLWSILLSRFPRDPEIESSLYGEFVSGSWSGPYSDRLQGQIELMNGLISSPASSDGVRHWARTVRKALVEQRDSALEREAEGGF